MADSIIQQIADRTYARELIISFPDNPEIADVSNENISAESLMFEESICDGNFKLGGCIASKFEIDLLNTTPNTIMGKKIAVKLKEYYHGSTIFPADEISLYPSDDIYPNCYFKFIANSDFFIGTIDSAKRQKDKQITHIIAYDDMYTIGNINCYEWFSSFCIYSPSATVKSLTESLLGSPLNRLTQSINTNNFGNANTDISLSLSNALAGDVCNGELLASEVLNNLCEIIGRFGVVEHGVFTLKNLSTDVKEISSYKDLDYEDYITNPFNIILCKYNKDKWAINKRASTNPSTYSISDNVITQCCDNIDTANAINAGLYNMGLTNPKYQFRPFSCTINDPGIKIGDKVKIPTGDDLVPYVESYVLKRTVKGINGMLITISADGDQQQTGNYNDENAATTAESESEN